MTTSATIEDTSFKWFGGDPHVSNAPKNGSKVASYKDFPFGQVVYKSTNEGDVDVEDLKKRYETALDRLGLPSIGLPKDNANNPRQLADVAKLADVVAHLDGDIVGLVGMGASPAKVEVNGTFNWVDGAKFHDAKINNAS